MSRRDAVARAQDLHAAANEARRLANQPPGSDELVDVDDAEAGGPLEVSALLGAQRSVIAELRAGRQPSRFDAGSLELGARQLIELLAASMTPRIPVTVSVAPAAGCDCASCPLFTLNPAAIEPICSGCNSDCSYCGCSRTTTQTTHNGCATCPIRCGSRTDIDAWMAVIGNTFGFHDIALDTQLPAGLPRFIPQVDGSDVAHLDEGLHWGAYAVGLRRVFSPRTHRIVPKFTDRTAHQALGLDPSQRAVLVGYGEDPLVEAFWSRRHSLIESLAAQQWDLVLAPNWSMYGNQPRAEHLLNFRRNLLVAGELSAAGIPAVPNLYWFRLEDLDRYLHWAQATGPAAVAINLQTFRTDADWELMALPGLTYLAHGLPAGCELIATGASRADRITTLLELFGPRLRLVSQNPKQYAAHGAVMTPTGRADIHAHTHDAFAASVRYYAHLLDEAA